MLQFHSSFLPVLFGRSQPTFEEESLFTLQCSETSLHSTHARRTVGSECKAWEPTPDRRNDSVSMGIVGWDVGFTRNERNMYTGLILQSLPLIKALAEIWSCTLGTIGPLGWVRCRLPVSLCCKLFCVTWIKILLILPFSAHQVVILQKNRWLLCDWNVMTIYEILNKSHLVLMVSFPL